MFEALSRSPTSTGRSRAAATAAPDWRLAMRRSTLGASREFARQLLDRSVGDNAALVEHDDAIRHLLGLVQIVGRDQDRRVLEGGELVDEAVKLAAGVNVANHPNSFMVE